MLAGTQAVNCGRVQLRDDPQRATACVLKAFSEKRAFRVRYYLQGIDSTVAVDVVGASDGKVFEIESDGNLFCLGGPQHVMAIRACPTP